MAVTAHPSPCFFPFFFLPLLALSVLVCVLSFLFVSLLPCVHGALVLCPSPSRPCPHTHTHTLSLSLSRTHNHAPPLSLPHASVCLSPPLLPPSRPSSLHLGRTPTSLSSPPHTCPRPATHTHSPPTRPRSLPPPSLSCLSCLSCPRPPRAGQLPPLLTPEAPHPVPHTPQPQPTLTPSPPPPPPHHSTHHRPTPTFQNGQDPLQEVRQGP